MRDGWMARILALVAVGLLGGLTPVAAQTFTSGSTGADGAFNPPSSVPPGTSVNGSTYTVPLPPHGVFNFTTVTIPSGTTVKFARNATNTPATLLASGDVTITGIIDLNGSAGGAYQPTTATYFTGGRGGPGGYDGGSGETRIGNSLAGTGQGPGGGKGPTGSGNPSAIGCEGGGAGYLSAGESGSGNSGCGTSYDGAGGPAYGNSALLPLLGGSGGGGGGAIFGLTGAGGGGGGGAIVIATSGTLTLTGTIRAIGGAGGNGYSGNMNAGAGGGGAGGAIRLLGTTLAGTGGTVTVSGGARGSAYGSYGGAGSAGRIRLEAFTSTASWTFSHTPSQTVPGSVQLANSPTLTITSVAGIGAPSAPTGSYSVPDITLPSSTTSPVTVALAASNIPLGTTVSVTSTPLVGTPTTATSTGLSGTVASSAATASLTVGFGTPVVISASATFTLLADAGGGPVYAEGEEVTHVRVAAALGGPSAVTYLTRSGREIVVR